MDLTRVVNKITNILMDDYEKRQLQNLVEIQVKELKRLRRRVIRLETNVVYRIITSVGDFLFAGANLLWKNYAKGKRGHRGSNKTLPFLVGKQWSFGLPKKRLYRQKKRNERTVWKARYAVLLSILKWRQDSPYAGVFKVRKAKKGTKGL